MVGKENKMDNSIYEVERNDYVAFLGQLKKDCADLEKYETEEETIVKLYNPGYSI